MTRRIPVAFGAPRRTWVYPTLSNSTILEVLATLALLGLLGGLGVSNLQRAEPQVGSGIQILASDLLWARSEAVRLRTPIRVTFSAATNSYRVTYESLEGDRELKIAFERDLSRDFPLIKLVEPGHATPQTVLFDARGTPRGLRSAAKIEIASSLDSGLRRCIFLEPKGLVTYSQTCAL